MLTRGLSPGRIRDGGEGGGGGKEEVQWGREARGRVFTWLGQLSHALSAGYSRMKSPLYRAVLSLFLSLSVVHHESQFK